MRCPADGETARRAAGVATAGGAAISLIIGMGYIPGDITKYFSSRGASRSEAAKDARRDRAMLQFLYNL
jgi:hypothetical protein